MNWITASILMFISSVIMYLLVRKAAIIHTPTQLTNLSMFLIPVVIYTSVILSGKYSLSISWYSFLIICISAYFFSYLGNLFSLKSIEYSPNPGYSLILSKSYVVFTTTASILLFRSTLTLNALTGIICIVLFSALIMINKNKSGLSHIKSSWLPLAIGAFFCWGMLALASKYLLVLGVDIVIRLFYLSAGVSCLILTDIHRKKIKYNALTKPQILILTAIGCFSASFNYFMQAGFNTAPNIGYVNAVNAASIAAVAVFSAIFFRDELTLRKMAGVIGVTAGLILLFL